MTGWDDVFMFRSTGGDLQAVVATAEALSRIPEVHRDTVLGMRTPITVKPGLLPDNEIHFYTVVGGWAVRLLKLVIADSEAVSGK